MKVVYSFKVNQLSREWLNLGSDNPLVNDSCAYILRFLDGKIATLKQSSGRATTVMKKVSYPSGELELEVSISGKRNDIRDNVSIYGLLQTMDDMYRYGVASILEYRSLILLLEPLDVWGSEELALVLQESGVTAEEIIDCARSRYLAEYELLRVALDVATTGIAQPSEHLERLLTDTDICDGYDISKHSVHITIPDNVILPTTVKDLTLEDAIKILEANKTMVYEYALKNFTGNYHHNLLTNFKASI